MTQPTLTLYVLHSTVHNRAQQRVPGKKNERAYILATTTLTSLHWRMNTHSIGRRMPNYAIIIIAIVSRVNLRTVKILDIDVRHAIFSVRSTPWDRQASRVSISQYLLMAADRCTPIWRKTRVGLGYYCKWTLIFHWQDTNNMIMGMIMIKRRGHHHLKDVIVIDPTHLILMWACMEFVMLVCNAVIITGAINNNIISIPTNWHCLISSSHHNQPAPFKMEEDNGGQHLLNVM